MILRLNGQTVTVFPDLLLEAVRDRLLDLFSLELDEPPCRMEAFGPDSPLLRWKFRISRENIGHMLLADTKASTNTGINLTHSYSPIPLDLVKH